MTSAETPDSYRKNVAIIVLNDVGEILACRRSDRHQTWQLPQGGVDDGETLEETLYRELLEEVGTAEVEIIGLLPHSINYEWPPEEYHRGFRGQEQSYYLVRLSQGGTVDLQAAETPEFDAVEWVGMQEFLHRHRPRSWMSYLVLMPTRISSTVQRWSLKKARFCWKKDMDSKMPTCKQRMMSIPFSR